MVNQSGEQEIWDIYDKDRVRTGRTCRRNEPIRKGEYHLVVHVCVLNSNNELLIQQRQPFKHGWPNMWDVTIGGSALAGENSSEAAMRELMEEVGIDVDLTDVRPVFTTNFTFGFDDYFIIRKDVNPEELQLQQSEVRKVKWADEKEVLNMVREGLFIPYWFLEKIFRPDFLEYSFERKSRPIKVQYATEQNLNSWMNLVEIVKDNFPGLETDEKLIEYRNTVIRFSGRKQAICSLMDNMVVGILLFSVSHNMICCMAVHPEFRRKGIASGMLRMALEQFDEKKPVVVETFRKEDEKGVAPRAFYKHFGFEEGELAFFEEIHPIQRFYLKLNQKTGD